MDYTKLGWEAFIAALSTMDEATVFGLINYEVSTKGRKAYVTRLHQRYCKLRDVRERDELLAGKLI